jgi:ABC-2 type transport system ATP-binding protein
VTGAAPPLTEAALATRRLTKTYGSVHALDDVSVTVPRGAVYGLVGPNGAGKTTLLSILVGLRRATRGDVDLGVDPARLAAVPDTPQFDPWLTAWEVVSLARTLAADATRPGWVEAALRRTGLADAADRRVGGFSRGMLQRLGLAAAIVTDPEVLVLDEPAAALDPAGRRDVLNLVADLAGATTVLFSSHILGDVQEVCDTIGILRGGRLLFEGSTRELLVGRAAPAYDIRLRPPADPVMRALAGEPWVTSVESPARDRLRVSVTTVDEAEARLAGALAGAGARMTSVVPAQTDLERVFLELTT